MDAIVWHGPTKRAIFEHFDWLAESIAALGFCVSEKRDLLSQWRGYASDGAGVAIGFRRELFDRIIIEQPVPDIPLQFTRVTYKAEDQRRAIEPIVHEIAADFIPELEKWSPPLPKILQLAPHCYTMKNEFFEEEQEWRLMAVVDTDEEWRRFEDCEFRAAETRIVPYREVPIDMMAIGEIVLGPRNRTPPRIAGALVARHGFEGVEVTTSSGTYG